MESKDLLELHKEDHLLVYFTDVDKSGGGKCPYPPVKPYLYKICSKWWLINVLFKDRFPHLPDGESPMEIYNDLFYLRKPKVKNKFYIVDIPLSKQTDRTMEFYGVIDILRII